MYIVGACLWIVVVWNREQKLISCCSVILYNRIVLSYLVCLLEFSNNGSN